MKKPKILFVAAEDWVFCTFRLPIARAARDAGCEVIVATRVNSNKDVACIEAEGFRVIALSFFQRGGMNPWREWLSIRELCHVYRKERPDLVHHAALKPVLYGSIAARMAHLDRVVNSLTGLGYIFTSKHFKAKLLRLFARLGFSLLLNRKNSRLIVQNRDDFQFFISSGLVRQDRVCLIRGSGVDTDRFKPISEPSEGIMVVTLVGRMLWDKGIAEFVEAVKTLKQHGVQLRALLVGFSDQENMACIPEAQLYEWQTAGWVEWLGQRDDIPDILAQSHIVVLPSYREGLPKTLLEAASSGRPIIATDVPGCREIVVHGVNGLLVPPKEAVSLAMAIKELLENAELRGLMGKAGRDMVERQFSEKLVAHETMSVYRSLLKEQWPAREPLRPGKFPVMTAGILVTGASGFIGRRLCHALQAKGEQVRALLRTSSEGEWSETVICELGAISATALKGVQTVFHLAGKAHEFPETHQDEMEYFRINTEGTRSLLEAAAAAGVRRFVFFSSVKAMGEGSVVSQDESTEHNPETPYGKSKLEAERLVLEGGYVPEPVVLRLSMVYGATHKGNLPRMIDAVARGRFPPMPEVGNRRSMVHVEDVVRAAILASEMPAAVGNTYIVTDGQPYSTRQIYEWICGVLNKRIPTWNIPLGAMKLIAGVGDGIGRMRGRRFLFDSEVLRKLAGSACYSSEKITRDLGFHARCHLKDSLPEIARFLGYK